MSVQKELANKFVKTLRRRAYGWLADNELEGDYGTWDDWRKALLEFEKKCRLTKRAPDKNYWSVKLSGSAFPVFAGYANRWKDTRMNEYIQALERVAKISAQIYKVTGLAFSRTKQICCPHGNCPSYPTHAWWCDQCWFELKEALENLESFLESPRKNDTRCDCFLCRGKSPIASQSG